MDRRPTFIEEERTQITAAWKWRQVANLLILAIVAFSGVQVRGQSTNPPALTISMTNQVGTNYLSLTVTNHIAGRNYELFYSYDVTTMAKFWSGFVTGTTNQTNFLVFEPDAPAIFF